MSEDRPPTPPPFPTREDLELVVDILSSRVEDLRGGISDVELQVYIDARQRIEAHLPALAAAEARQAELTRVCEQLQQALSVKHHQLVAAEQHVTELREGLERYAVEMLDRFNTCMGTCRADEDRRGAQVYWRVEKELRALLARTAPPSMDVR